MNEILETIKKFGENVSHKTENIVSIATAHLVFFPSPYLKTN